MDRLEEVRKQIGKEFVVNPNELHCFKKGKCTLTYIESKKLDVKWRVDLQLLSSKAMKITNIRVDSVLKVV